MQAIFIGWKGNWRWRETKPCTMPGVYTGMLPYDFEGNVISPFDSEGKYVDPETLTNFAYHGYVELWVGQPCLLPSHDPEALENALQSQEFAKPEYQELINEMYEGGAEGDQVYERLIELDAIYLPQTLKPVEKAG